MMFARLLQLNMLGKQTRKRMLAGLLVFTLLIQCVVLPGAVRADAATTASAKGVLDIGSASVSHSETLADNGDGTYTYTMDLYIPGAFDDESMSETVARNGYFTASHEGDFLVEIWGGDGADGGVTNYSYNGTAAPGGKGGYLYGVVHLERGETLFYTLGGNGQQTDSTTAGGGVNGDGGAHGDLGSVKVGGGGGYSAVFKFDKDDKFAETYLDADGNIALEGILESDRLNKYIMVAGGGGGGGGGNGIIGGTARSLPYGGAGGGMDSASTTISGGTVYFGQDGGSSGTSFDYIGHGATQNPGAIEDTWIDLGWFEGKQPNDWTGSLNSAYTGGAGGAGNFRGGAGGGGFAGGSGGVQTEIIVASNVGGGGGGSSYIEKSIVDATDYEKISGKLVGTNPSDHGGAVVVTCLGEHDSSDPMANLSVSGETSDYFEIVTGKSSASIGGAEKSGAVTASGFNLSGDVHQKGGFRIELVLKPKDGFAGGNNVPVLKNFKFTGDQDIPVDESCTHANVPLQMEAIGKSYSSTTKPFTKNTADLYENNIDGITVGSGNYKFIEAISQYAVYDADDNKITSDSVSVEETTKYKVAYTVTPDESKGYAQVGTPLKGKQEISAYAVLVVNLAADGVLGENGPAFNYSKNLVYNGNGTYTLSLNAKGTGKKVTYEEWEEDVTVTVPASKPDPISVYYGGSTGSYLTAVGLGTYDKLYEDTCDKYTVEVPVEGYYLIQLWAANGGNAYGGTGGDGGYVYGYAKLQVDADVSVVVGAAGAKREASGQPSFVEIEDVVTMIARGGDGAGYFSDGKDSVTTGEGNADANGDGAAPGNYAGQTSKNRTDNYRDASMYANVNGLTDLTAEQKTTISNALTSAANNTRSNTSSVGEVKITCLVVTGTTTTTQTVTKSNEEEAKTNAPKAFDAAMSLDTKFEKYFTITGVTASDANSGDGKLSFTADDDTSDGVVSLTNIKPAVDTKKVTDEMAYQSKVDFTVNITFKPKDGFLGGNNVPVLVYEDASNTGMTLQQGTNTIAIKQQDTTDFVNVEIPAVDASGLKLENPTYVLGTGAMKIEKGTMYSWDNKQDDEDWWDDFVYFTGPTHDESFTPKVDDPNYEITVGIKPTHTGTAVKAVVVPEVSSDSVKKTGSVNIINQIHYNLTNMTTTHVEETVDGYVDENKNPKKFYLHPLSTNYATILKPETGYLLPTTITVERGGTTLTAGTDYVYYSDTGEVLVYAAAINNEPITITAEGRVQTYDIYFISTDVPSMNRTFTYESSADLSTTDKTGTGSALDYFNNSAGDAPEEYGHSFVWEWDGEVPSVMPAGNQWVFGAYVPNNYPLTIHYDAPGYTDPPADVVQQIPYGSDFSVPSPVIDGYRLVDSDQLTVTGTMVNSDKQTVIPDGLSFTVKYEPIPEGNVDINYVFTDGSPATTETKTESETNPGEKLTPNGHYEFTLTPQTGYTIYDAETGGNEITTVSVTMDNDANGQQITVYCRPDRYQLSFNTDGGNTIDPVYIQYNQPYGSYTSAVDGTLTYQQLPTPTRNGYKFLGWYLGETQIKPETMVDTVNDRTLTAKWEMITYKVTVRYYCPYPTEHELGTYSQTLPSYEGGVLNSYTLVDAAALAVANGIQFDGHDLTETGFTLTADKTTVNMDANQVINVQVVYGPKTLTIHYVDANGTEMKPTYTQDDLFAHQEYRVESPEIADYVANTPVVEGSMGMEDVTVTVLYRTQAQAAGTKVKVTVTWGDLNFKYDYGTWNPENHTYEGGSFTPNTDGGNTVTVENGKYVSGDVDATESNIYVYAELSYEARNNTPYPDTNVYFTEDNNASGTRTNGMNVNTEKGLAPGDDYVAYIWTEGTMPVSARNNTDPITLGKCNVTIRAGKDYTP